MHPDCALDVQFAGLYIDKYKKGKVSQLWVFKDDSFFNQGEVMNAFSSMPGTRVNTSRLSHFGRDEQKFYVMQKDNIKNQGGKVHLTR